MGALLPEEPNVLRLGIVADDLTGAMDSGVRLAKWGLQTLVLLISQGLPEADALVLSTDSRGASPAEAYRRANAAARRLKGRTLYKKMDSAMRGNVGQELDGVLDAVGLQRALVAPAAPFAGRATVNGCHRVNGVPVAETDFARDPVAPVTESHLPSLLARQTRRKVGHLPLRVVEQGAEAVTAALVAEPATVVAADAVEPRHLWTLALALQRQPEPWLPCGSAGLAEAWTACLGLSRPEINGPAWPSDGRPVLIISGSRHSATLAQLKRAESEELLQLVHLAPPAGLEQASHWSHAAEGTLAELEAGHNVALTLSFSAYVEGQQQAAAEALAQAAAWVLEHAQPAGLFVTGGDTLQALCHTLGSSALLIVGEVQPGVPAGRLVLGSGKEPRIVTKAGAFGDDQTVVRCIHFIQGRQT